MFKTTKRIDLVKAHGVVNADGTFSGKGIESVSLNTTYKIMYIRFNNIETFEDWKKYNVVILPQQVGNGKPEIVPCFSNNTISVHCSLIGQFVPVRVSLIKMED